ncbi:metalloregulator ArsR/SmtB family transcription factor [Parvibaculum sp.]|jgi:ArsR family transcriptional regulator|uniref:ArsR/SmtB family transcription factor n=1 Tax=Parvibaculum sp. TaxID=2024848 RepID=UPI001B14F998|nr:metalloregulator ArsR/SmtB family transcription factor [Parvibaculum sp.]MBO6635685.1 metalloregulator ArsR/SmtB family transcription factor [Parvibaculum sp.]MBO6679720.1 metalloregulator ArsR/SmtB family transcription factor [Parvibaculum sp.]MBO6686302.1 metalloregulator ArsR/SmtB family transcription factor [Parvibaculum sp.]MBO6905257.1 metalloregulator ArsR/SmtB family transcription factor [Parvibaculum sp.]
MDQLLAGLRAAGEPTRLRLLALLAHSELTVTELTQILRQSQPRVSRHLKLLCEAGLLERFREGSWVFYRLAGSGQVAELAEVLSGLIPQEDLVIARDLERLEAVRSARAEKAAAYFRSNAEEWDRIRSLYVPEDKVEQTMAELGMRENAELVADLGTGTGRMLELFGPMAKSGIGIDLSPEMLALARAQLAQPSLQHCSVRQGDLYDLPMQDDTVDLVTLHMVLHYLDDPAASIAEAARVLKPGGRLLIADFAPHDLDFLREGHAHRRLGFSQDEVAGWLADAGLEVGETKVLPPEGGEDAKLTVLIWVADKTEKQFRKAERSVEFEGAK